MNNKDIRILVVDDDPDVLFATARIMKKEGYDVSEAATGQECLEQTERQQPDLILLDVELPDILGTEVCHRLKSDDKYKSIYIMMLSGRKIETDDQADGLEVGADGYVARPVSNRELRARVGVMARLIRAERKCAHYIVELEQALAQIKVMSGIIPICSHCKQIRDDQGYWNRLENYIQAHSEAKFSHSVCEECLDKYYPEVDFEDEENY
ncbi:MAG: DNA-binding response regulator [Desulfobulbaceae bacterium]|nr:MAG: DNA-binding response regulator [Desulfobulbaceae bacterium]